MNPENFYELIDSEQDSFYTSDADDSENDPSFDLLEETRSKLSSLSIKKKPKSRVLVEVDEDAGVSEVFVADFDANDQKSYETVQKMIECGQVEKLKVDQCKLYLRKHGLRLTGKKDILISRIKEHVSIMNGEGERKYPPSSFVMNCKGDACTGDVVMFEQNVYEMFNIASRSASGPPCGKRVVAGRIVKESYGAAKQQHTFTIEVLWSKGAKSLPPLHPLLIKGRNLYRLKTLRQRWDDESERQRILSEKHDRGNEARSKRDSRLQEKERRKALRENRPSKGNTLNRPEVAKSNPQALNHKQHEDSYKENMAPKTSSGPAVGLERDAFIRKTFEVKQNFGSCPLSTFERHEHVRTVNMYHHHQGPPQKYSSQQGYKSGHEYAGRASVFHPQSPQRYVSRPGNKYDYDGRPSTGYPLSPQRHAYQQGNKYDYDGRVTQRYGTQPGGYKNDLLQRGRCQGQKQQPCRHYARGTCYYGTDCKFLH